MIRSTGTRVKTGCKTCRIRRVKCDEARPVCNRCSSTGRKCDGYEVCAPSLEPYRKRILRPRASSLLALSPVVGYFPRLTPAEAQSFVYFRDCTSREAAGCFVSAFWPQLVLQLAHREAAVLHAAVGVGAMHRSTRGRSPSLRLPGHVESHHTLALGQYVKAMHRLRRRLEPLVADRQGPEIVLVTCLLFVCPEMLQGNRLGALVHVRNGLRILASIPSQVRRDGESDGEPQWMLVIRDRPTGLEQLTEIFARLDVDSTSFGERAPVFRMTSKQVPHGPETLAPAAFQDVTDARNCLDRLTSTAHDIRGQLLALSRQSCRSPLPRDAALQCCVEFAGIRKLAPLQDAALFAQLETLKTHLSHRLVAFQHLNARAPAQGCAQDPRPGLLLEIQLHSVFLQLATCHNDRETACDRFTPVFQRVVDLCSRLIGETARSSVASLQSPRPTFVLDSGLIPSLYLTGLKCRQSEIRQRAISLLSQYPCQEGMWEPALMAHFVQGVRQLEEETAQRLIRQGASTGRQWEGVSEAARFCDVVLAVTERVGEGRLVCARYLHETTGELEITEHLIPIPLTE